MDYLCAKFSDFSFSRFGFIVRQIHGHRESQTHRQTDRQTDSHTEADDRYTRAITST